MVKAVIIDIDDTLCLTEAVCFEMENEIMRRMGRKLFSREIHINTWGTVLEEAISIRSPGIDFEQFKIFFQKVMREYVRLGKLDFIAQENYETLDRLIEDGKKIILLTSRSELELEHMLEPDHLLASRVHEFYHKDNIKFHKPDPRAFNELLANNSLLSSECVYVGDSVGDAAAAKGAGLSFIASLESGIRQESDFKDYDVDAFVRKFPDIIDAINSLN